MSFRPDKVVLTVWQVDVDIKENVTHLFHVTTNMSGNDNNGQLNVNLSKY